MPYLEYQKKEIGFGLNSFNKPVEYSGVGAWVRLITQLLFTRPGTYPTDPTLGVGLQDYRFSFFDEIRGALEENINRQIQIYLPDLPVSSVSCESVEIGGKDVMILSFSFQVMDTDLQTAYVAVDTSTRTINYEVAF